MAQCLLNSEVLSSTSENNQTSLTQKDVFVVVELGQESNVGKERRELCYKAWI